jgi:prophage antirepressor-like protein
MPTAISTYHHEVALRKRDLGTTLFDGARLRTATIDGASWILEEDVFWAVDRDLDDEALPLLERVAASEVKLVVLGDLETGDEIGSYVSVIGAMTIALGCSDAASPWSAAGRFLRWLASDALPSATPRRKRGPAPLAGARRYGGLAVLDGGLTARA